MSPDELPERAQECHDPLELTRHAEYRMYGRGLSRAAIQAGLEWGRTVHVRGAEIYAIGRREISSAAHKGVDLSRLSGLQVVCHPDGAILTVYKNKDFRSLKPRRRRSSGDQARGH